MLRFRQEFRAFSRLQGSRATILAVGTLSGALLAPTFMSAVVGLLAGYVVYTLLAVALTRSVSAERASFDATVAAQAFRLWQRRSRRLGRRPAGAARPEVDPDQRPRARTGAAGALLALDLLQRPFVLIVSALQAIQYPDVVSLYDRDGETPALRRRNSVTIIRC